MTRRTKVLITLILLLLLMTGGAYALGAHYFSHHFMPGTTLNGYNVSYMSEEEAEALMDREVKAYALAIETRGNGREALTAAQVGLSYASDGRISYLLTLQDVLRWFMEFNGKRAFDLSRSISYDDAKMDAAIQDLDCMQSEAMKPPVDAAIVENEDGYTIRREVKGSTLDPQKVGECIRLAMVSGKNSVNLEEQGCYLSPAVSSDDELLQKNCDTLNRMTSVIITYDFGRRTYTVDRDLVKQWLTRGSDGLVKLNRDLARQYVEQMAQATDTVGTSRNFETYDGRQIQIGGGDYGWILDVDKEADTLVDMIEKGETMVREPEYSQSAQRRDGQNDIGYTYVEVDITAQKLVYYENGQPLIETDCVTGNPNMGLSTPTGVFRGGVKESPKVLLGGFGSGVGGQDTFTSDQTFADSQIELGAAGATANAYFWMPFGSLGITEGINRNEFGSSFYMLRGTGGNVEIVYDSAAALYNKFYEGIPVIIYM